jgi:hypothetical protein
MKVTLQVVTDGDDQVQAAFHSHQEALGYVWMMFDPSSTEEALAHIETCDVEILGDRYERSLGKSQE